jgi:hypothetical protein
MSGIPKSWTTLTDIHRLFIQPHQTNSLEVTEFCAVTTLLNLPLSGIPKSWTTLTDIHRLFIQPHQTNSLEVTEFCAVTTLLNLFWTAQQLEETKF